MQSYLKRILTARVYDVAIESPLELAPSLSARIGNNVLLKREDMQPVFSFKLRGAYNKMAQLTQEQLKRGVIAASAGNHAQGVALSAQQLGCKAIIVMPATTPQDEDRGGRIGLRAGDRAAWRLLQRRLRACAGAGERKATDLCASVRRSGCDRRTRHHRHGNPAPAPSADRRHLLCRSAAAD